jgi:SAM-dependent methyltransferase
MSRMSQYNSPPQWIRDLPNLPAWVEERPAAPWNLCGMLRAWNEYPLAMDFLNPRSSNFHYKALQTRLYRERLAPLFESSTQPMRVLDAACGIGRLLIPLAEQGHTVIGVDACEPSLRAAARHIEAAMGDGRIGIKDTPTLHWDDVDELNCLAGQAPFDLILALELLCYLHEPSRVATKLAHHLKPGGHLVVSVEAWPGALLCDADAVREPEQLRRALEEGILAVPEDRWLQAVDASELESILQCSGLDVLWIEGTHFLPDGPLAACLDLERLTDPSYVDAVVALEQRCAKDQRLRMLPRALLAVARKPG